MKNNLTSLIVGIIFSLGLGISGMTQPEKIFHFLDVFQDWDPSLLFVMIGAIGFHFFAFKIIRRRKSPLFSEHWHLPTKTKIEGSLMLGSLIFGVGWGLAGYCPGPALTALASLDARPIIFVVSMVGGFALFRALKRKV